MEKEKIEQLGLRNKADQHNAKSEAFVKVYANNVMLSASNWDMSLVFGEIIGLAEDGMPVVEQKVKVNMTREFIKALRNLLTVNLDLYEKHFGEIGFVNMDDMPPLQGVGPEDLVTKKTPARKPRKAK